MASKKKAGVKSPVLAALRIRSLYGFELAKSLGKSAPELLAQGEGVIYPLLRRLEGLHLIEGAWKPNPKGKRRRYYSLTKKGRRKLYHLDCPP